MFAFVKGRGRTCERPTGVTKALLTVSYQRIEDLQILRAEQLREDMISVISTIEVRTRMPPLRHGRETRPHIIKGSRPGT